MAVSSGNQTLSLCKYRGFKNALSKSLTLFGSGRFTIEGFFVNPVNLNKLDLVVRVRKPDNIDNIAMLEYNYCDLYLKDAVKTTTYKHFYYFINKVEFVGSNTFDLYLRLDVLYTHYNFLITCFATITESQNDFTPFASNFENIFDVRPQFQKIDFSVVQPFGNSDSVILITTKGKTT